MYMSETERERLGLVVPMPGNPNACWMCHESGQGDGPGDVCTRCRGYGVEPRWVFHSGRHAHLGYGSRRGAPVELGPAIRMADYE